MLKLSPTDLLLYSAKIIPGNDTKVMSMMNNVSALGVEIAMGASEGLHTSGHAYRYVMLHCQLCTSSHFNCRSFSCLWCLHLLQEGRPCWGL